MKRSKSQENKLGLKRAGITCLFCFAVFSVCLGQYIGQGPSFRAHQLILDLKLDQARQLIGNSQTAQDLWLLRYADAVELLTNGDERLLEKYEAEYNQTMGLLRNRKTSSADDLFAAAEIRLQWAFVYGFYGHFFSAAWNVKQAHSLVQECKQRFPDYLPIKRTSGLLNTMLGSVPDKYQWVLGLFNMKASVEEGLLELSQIGSMDSPIGRETALMHYLVQGLILQETEKAAAGSLLLATSATDHTLFTFVAALLAVKNSQSEDALSLLRKMDLTARSQIPHRHYLLGEVLLHKGEYQSAIQEYTTFINTTAGTNNVKDALYKSGLCHLLSGNIPEANKSFNRAKATGTTATESDRYADRQLKETSLPNAKLLQIRFATDGGYYDRAQSLISTVTPQDLKSDKDRIEFTYRRARLAHKAGQPDDAKRYYLETIEQGRDHEWYFAPNSCLQLGYLYREAQDLIRAREFFTRALSYKNHEYKNSIDSKAKSALQELPN